MYGVRLGVPRALYNSSVCTCVCNNVAGRRNVRSGGGGSSSSAGRKEMRNKYSSEGPCGERSARDLKTGRRRQARAASPARKIHIFKYFSHAPQSARHAALPPTLLPSGHYVPTTYPRAPSAPTADTEPEVRRVAGIAPLCPPPPSAGHTRTRELRFDRPA